MTRARALLPGRGGSRIEWGAVPGDVRASIEERLGGRVTEALSQDGGFSPGVAARVRLDDGRRFFVKAACSRPNADTPRAHRKEIRIAPRLPHDAPVSRMLFGYDDGEWVALVFDDVDGHPPSVPWSRDEFDRVLAAVEDLGHALTPSPVEAPPVPTAHAETFAGWERLRAAPERLAAADPWVQRNIGRLIDDGTRWPEIGAGETLLHSDIRADNILLTAQRVHFVDWAHACVGARWLDLLWMLPSVAMQGGPDPWDVFDDHPVGRTAEPGAATTMLSVLTGYFLDACGTPPPPGLPTVRAFQRAQGGEALEWLKRRTGWE